MVHYGKLCFLTFTHRAAIHDSNPGTQAVLIRVTGLQDQLEFSIGLIREAAASEFVAHGVAQAYRGRTLRFAGQPNRAEGF